MHLESTILVNKSEEQVWEFLNDITNLARWDHSVEKVIITSGDKKNPIGLTFDTIGPAKPGKTGLKTSYEVITYIPTKSSDAKVTHSNLFKQAVWKNKTEKGTNGTFITISVDFSLKHRFKLLYPIIYLRKGAIDRDMRFLKEAIEK